MSALEAVTGHYRNQLAGGLQSIDVPEWQVDGKPLVIWFKPATNPKTQEILSKLFSEKKPIEATVQALIIRALNEDGTPMFKSVNKTELMNHCDVDVLIRVVGEINNFQAVDQDIEDKT